MKVFQEFHSSGIINQSTNATFIVLVPRRINLTRFWILDLLAWLQVFIR